MACLRFLFMVFRRLIRFSSLFFNSQPFAVLRLFRERGPGGFRPSATLAHMVERRRFSLVAGLVGTGKEELQI